VGDQVTKSWTLKDLSEEKFEKFIKWQPVMRDGKTEWILIMQFYQFQQKVVGDFRF